ncbi:hypothetical protein [Polynucleobacter sp. UK-Kesae-W10]|uniref:hypothetical protein n=1 Tax=Polynucleobacter sp. UK-Kesae-W10 TaxID=1819738 RepID=UPI001C0B22B2|nr:hypothetical protein [Polynucleobacter sp. UK-Kesae-W10]MBU3577600.1 hypothetical protein [Polynucleobacter sp. UK-Kesae-W10]
MIYPFRVINSKPIEGGFGVTIELSKVVRYEPSIDPSTQYKTPILELSTQYHTIDAASLDEALGVIAQNVANS